MPDLRVTAPSRGAFPYLPEKPILIERSDLLAYKRAKEAPKTQAQLVADARAWAERAVQAAAEIRLLRYALTASRPRNQLLTRGQRHIMRALREDGAGTLDGCSLVPS